jgi:SAM-dependent methyltransferase
VAASGSSIAAQVRLQEAAHGVGHDYEAGSPHLRHAYLRKRIIDSTRALVLRQLEISGRCRVLEVGAGHGGFTDHLLAAGADVTVTEMSLPSLDVLRSRLAHNPRVRFIHEEDGERVFREESEYDLIFCISVLHHIHDYLGYVERLCGLLSVGGSLASFQDPLWYSRRSSISLLFERGAYFAWRLGQGRLMDGLKTRVRRLRNIYDEENPADMVEYHVVRNGLDEQALVALLQPLFLETRIWRYWSTQAPAFQWLGPAFGLESTFGLMALGRR